MDDVMGDVFRRPTDEDRARRAADLLHRAGLARTYGWDEYRSVWSTGEVAGVAALLGRDDVLAGIGETVQSTWERWAFDLWGVDDGQADVAAGCPATRDWFAATEDQL